MDPKAIRLIHDILFFQLQAITELQMAVAHASKPGDMNTPRFAAAMNQLPGLISRAGEAIDKLGDLAPLTVT